MRGSDPIKPLLLIVLDGIGIAPATAGNAVTSAQPQFLAKCWDSYPHTYLQASGQHVGLPPGIKGNSEVGHTHLGSGKTVFQELPRIDRAIQNGSFYSNQVLVTAFNKAKEQNGRIHVAVCFSDAGVHGTIAHLEALLDMSVKLGNQQPIVIHAFTDGRDSPPTSASQYFTRIEQKIQAIPNTSFGTIMGRYYAMDRNESWDRIELAYKALTQPDTIQQKAPNWQKALETAYANKETDEFIKPIILDNYTPIQDNDSFILLNFRSDRAVELSSAFLLPQFDKFARAIYLPNLHFVGMTEYAKGIPANIAFPKENISLPLGRIIAENGMRQLRIAESEKFPHVTYFFNGGRSIKFDAEDRVEVPSPTVATYDLQPEMSLPEVTRILQEKIAQRTYDFILVNFANGDMVGHTGNLDACKKAIQAVDNSTQSLISAIHANAGAAIITADHGNAEEMLNIQTGDTDTEHSANPVPFVFLPPKPTSASLNLPGGALSDVAPTILDIMGITKPSELSGRSLLS